jgi:hypothetical protein
MKHRSPLSASHPLLAAQAHGWDPATLTRGSGKRVQWVCSAGHIWVCPVASRKRLDECAVCAGKQVNVGVNDLATTDPDIAAQAHGWDPTTLTRGSGKRVQWVCVYGHVFVASISQVVRGRGCGVCSGRQIVAGVNDLASRFPHVASEADGWDPSTVGHGSSKRMMWKCQGGHSWIASVSSRTRLGAGCPSCAGNVLTKGVNDLATFNPSLAEEAFGWDPSTVAAHSHQMREWICKTGHVWTAQVNSRTRGNSCPVCSGHQVLAGVNDLATTHPILAKQADGWDPTTLSSGSNKKVWWRCKDGHSWESVVHSRALDGIGCPVCSGKKVLLGFNDLKTTNPDLAAQADGWDPTTLTKFSNKKMKWRCPLGHKWSAVVGNRTYGRDCPTCAGRVVLPGFNDLATTNPEIAAMADGWDPTQVGRGNNQPRRWWKCPSGHRWRTSVNNVRGCPTCAQSGYDPGQPGWLYFIHHYELSMFQIGISNFPEKRLSDHSRRGWEVVEVRGPMDGHLAQDLETAILRAVERRGALLGHKAEVAKFDGYSEAWMKGSLSVTGFKQLLGWVYDDDRSLVRRDTSKFA